MPEEVGREQVRTLTQQGAQLVEVLPEREYGWAHLPGAVSIPLESLPDRAVDLDRTKTVIVYCHDTLCDMSPRAASWLAAHGFAGVHDYTAGKTDWLAADLPYEGQAQLVGRYTRRDVATVLASAPVQEAIARRTQVSAGPVLVVDDHGVVQGAAYRKALEEADPQDPVESVTRFGISTVRPSEEVAPLLQRMSAGELGRIAVTRSDGTLVGLFVAADVHAEAPAEPERAAS